jgi:hypothetical protein
MKNFAITAGGALLLATLLALPHFNDPTPKPLISVQVARNFVYVDGRLTAQPPGSTPGDTPDPINFTGSDPFIRGFGCTGAVDNIPVYVRALVATEIHAVFSGVGAPPTSSSPPTAPPPTSQDFTIVVLPDIQGYTQAFPSVLNAQTQWIVHNKNTLNIQYVIQNGDLVETKSNATEWTRASDGLGILDGVVPYGITVGNHDLDDDQSTGAGSTFRQYFPISRFSAQPGFGGYYSASNITRNSWYHTFSAGGLDFLVLNLEWEAPDDVLSWAAGVLRNNPNHRVISATHHYLNPNPPHRDTSWPWPRYGPNLGEDIWREFVKLHPNIFMVHSAHIFGEDRQTSMNNAGKPVYEIVTNYHPRLPNGGDGWLRYYTFKPSLNEIHAFTYSPTLNQFQTDSNSQFILPYNMTGSTPPPFPAPPPSDTIAPFTPINLSASPISSSSINLSWPACTDNVGATGSHLERCQGFSCTNFTQIASPSGIAFSDTNLSANTISRYRVGATDED